MNRTPAGPGVACFDVYEVEVSLGELRRNGMKVPLQEQPFRLLVTLLENAGRVVTREDLRERLWPEGTFVDFDHSLNTAVRKLRAALEDSAETPRFVETLARRGYRFLVPVEWKSETPVRKPSPTRWFTAVVLTAGVALLAGTNHVGRPAESTNRIDSVAVFPFASRDSSVEYLGDGLAEAVIDELSIAPDLRVLPRSTAFRYKARVTDPMAIGRELKVDAVVTGMLDRVGGEEVRLRAEMVSADSGAQLWARQYHIESGNLDAVRRKIASDISYRLGTARADRAGRGRDPSPAFDLYLQGRLLWNRRGRDSVLRAVDYFERAVRLDPDFALGYAGLANGYGAIAGNGLLPGQESAMQARARAAADRAIELDPTLAEAYASRAAGLSSYSWDFGAAERDFRRAIELNPGYASAHQWYGIHLYRLGRNDEGRREIELAYQLEPFSIATNSYFCWSRLWDRRYDDGIAFCLDSARIDRSLVNRNCLFECQALAGRYQDAIETVRSMSRRRSAEFADALDAAFRRGGPQAFWYTRMEQEPESDPYTRAEYSAMAGDPEAAFRYLEAAFARRQSQVPGIYKDPMLDSLRDDPRFDELGRRIGLPRARR